MKKLFLSLFLIFFPTLSYLPNHPIGYVPQNKKRPSNPPFITGDTFRDFCDHIFDETNQQLDPNNIKMGDTIFVNGDMLYRFFRYMHSRIQHSYILVTHNSDMSVPDYFAPYLEDPKLIAWFGMNRMIPNHPKLHAIPIGVENAHFNKAIHLKEALKDIPPLDSRSDKPYLNFRARTNLILRSFVWNLFAHKPFIYAQKDRSYEDYINDMKHSKFIICPAGYGIDCHRYWESLLLGCIPIMKHSTIDKLFEDLPVILVDNWREVNEAFLKRKYQEIKGKRFNLKKLYADYWLDQIKECQERYRKTH